MSENNRHTEDAKTAQTAQVQESSIFAPLGRVKGVLIVSMVLAVCVMALELPFWFRAALLALVVLGAVWVANEVGSGEPEAAPVKDEDHSEMAGVSGERLADLLTDPMIVFDHGGTVLFANAAALEAFQSLESGTALYLRFRAPEMHALIQGVIADGEPRSIEYFERVPIDRWYKAMVKALPDMDGRPELFVLIFRDQSETRRIDRMRSDFIANASHELRTPLASLRGFIETLQGPARNDVAARDRFLDIMQKQAERMSRLIDDLLSLSRLEMRAHLAVNESVDLTAVINHVTDTLTPLAANLGVAIERNLPDRPVLVTGARDELIQVFQNLVENACKYGQGGKKVIVKLETDETGSAPEVVASVQDFGPGISAEHLPRLTERFYRIDVETSRAQKGTGLGLAIVKHILARHRGRLVVRSQLGEGSTFMVRLPKREG
ncbi:MULTISPECIES: ATP-binding protein [Brucella/Ochrobactrum group]|uniref:histidine kinase n=1 Tax=Ochrobactrum soli TaxID=2448455 RepID=A0A2P9HK75_9HYPH|nr:MULTISPECIES: ATP-binding protein [Brucella]MCI1000712.1 PAS domain-containing protein [Ochrobactrum sp. C6C9]RRD27994.1 two-component sensor histidine kinase [Brucellaceae bacterium VT-16-1752]WHT41153.1 ATP-binding protein [Ochrobactrum sp. SSR]MDX4075780.1 ATP-binding protein [Brucella sp. NBRC 113783]RLL75299.1 two-component sensor histidine kinase [[Ochrobactrum] soli]